MEKPTEERLQLIKSMDYEDVKLIKAISLAWSDHVVDILKHEADGSLHYAFFLGFLAGRKKGMDDVGEIIEENFPGTFPKKEVENVENNSN